MSTRLNCVNVINSISTLGELVKPFISHNGSIKCVYGDEDGYRYFRYASLFLDSLSIENPVIQYILQVSQYIRQKHGSGTADMLFFYICSFTRTTWLLTDMGVPLMIVLNEIQQAIDDCCEYIKILQVPICDALHHQQDRSCLFTLKKDASVERIFREEIAKDKKSGNSINFNLFCESERELDSVITDRTLQHAGDSLIISNDRVNLGELTTIPNEKSSVTLNVKSRNNLDKNSTNEINRDIDVDNKKALGKMIPDEYTSTLAGSFKQKENCNENNAEINHLQMTVPEVHTCDDDDINWFFEDFSTQNGECITKDTDSLLEMDLEERKQISQELSVFQELDVNAINKSNSLVDVQDNVFHKLQKLQNDLDGDIKDIRQKQKKLNEDINRPNEIMRHENDEFASEFEEIFSASNMPIDRVEMCLYPVKPIATEIQSFQPSKMSYKNSKTSRKIKDINSLLQTMSKCKDEYKAKKLIQNYSRHSLNDEQDHHHRSSDNISIGLTKDNVETHSELLNTSADGWVRSKYTKDNSALNDFFDLPELKTDCDKNVCEVQIRSNDMNDKPGNVNDILNDFEADCKDISNTQTDTEVNFISGKLEKIMKCRLLTPRMNVRENDKIYSCSMNNSKIEISEMRQMVTESSEAESLSNGHINNDIKFRKVTECSSDVDRAKGKCVEEVTVEDSVGITNSMEDKNDNCLDYLKIFHLVRGLNCLADKGLVQVICEIIQKHSIPNCLRIVPEWIMCYGNVGARLDPVLVNGIVIETALDNMISLTRLRGKYCRVLLVNADITMSYRHKGHKPVKATKWSEVTSMESGEITMSAWQKELSYVLKMLAVDIVLGRGKISEDVLAICAMLDIVAIDNVPYNRLQQISEASLVDMVTYISLATEVNVCTNVLVAPWQTDILDRKSQLGYSVGKILLSLQSKKALTVVLNDLTPALIDLKEQELWNCLKKVTRALHSGFLLPGDGQTEEKCLKHFTGTIDLIRKSIEISAHANQQYKEIVIEALMTTFQEYVNFITNSDPKLDCVYDDFTSKVDVWRLAVNTVCVIMNMDTFIQTGIPDAEMSYATL